MSERDPYTECPACGCMRGLLLALVLWAVLYVVWTNWWGIWR